MSVRQLDPGTYSVKVASGMGTPVLKGLCFVEGLTGGDRVEHYAMFNDYTPPSSGERLIIAPVGAGGTSYGSLSAFLSAMRDEEPEEAPYKYIEATCRWFSALP